LTRGVAVWFHGSGSTEEVKPGVATIAEVAREARVGVATVSRVLNGSPAVRDQTRRRVLDAIARLGYAPNAAARALSTGRTQAVGVLAPFFTRPSVMERLRGICGVLADGGYQLVLFDVERPADRDGYTAALPGGGLLDGLLSISLCPSEAELERFADACVPVVLVDHAHERVPAVYTDDVAGGRLATEHLLALGHRRIAFVGDSEANGYGFTSSAMRRAGYEAALTAAGVELDPALVRRAAHGREAAVELTRELLEAAEPPTALFAASDTQAVGALEAADALGAAVPGDLSVVGYDDIELARYAGLTTVAQPLEESGRRGAELLLAALGGTPAKGRQLPVELVVRATTGPPERRGRSPRKHEGRGRERQRQTRLEGTRVRSQPIDTRGSS
jgi:DNA-binding LacI/PurR family transcriptional regulator